MSSPELCQLPARGLARLLRQRKVSAVEVLEAHLVRIEQHNSLLNAVVSLDALAGPLDGTVAARLRAAGAIIIGHANVPPWLADHQPPTRSSAELRTPGTPHGRPGAQAAVR